ncbi:hypothetical protein GA0070606_6117 [Micromonospora citrea]|uniref:Uncharacterized protein n=2 Tax=Micromonospora citrea TaxID=47855 RepID=A0A1C6W224_9ACTN|nr:hypothetical protein GA0070606_6117 [Micromonospora citrea]
MVVIPPGRTRYSTGIAVFDDSVAALRRFVTDSLARAEGFVEARNRHDEIELRLPVVLGLMPRPDNTYNPKAISAVAPPSSGGSVIDRHMGFLYDSTLHWVGESLQRLAVAAAPHPIGCHGWVRLHPIEDDELDDDGEWEPSRDDPFSPAEQRRFGYQIGRLYLDLPDSGPLHLLVDGFAAAAPPAVDASVDDVVRAGVIAKFGQLLRGALAARLATGSWGVPTERSRTQDRWDAAASADLRAWADYRRIPHPYEGLRAISRSTWGFERIIVTDHCGLEVGRHELPDGPLTLIDERARPDAVAALRDHGVDVSLPDDFEELGDFPDAIVRTDRLRDDPTDRERIWSIRLVRDGVDFDELPEAGMYDPDSDVLTVYARPHIAPMTTLLRRHDVRPARVRWASPSSTTVNNNRRAAAFLAAEIGPFRPVVRDRSIHQLGGGLIVDDLAVVPASCSLTARAVDLVPEPHRPWLNVRARHEPAPNVAAFTLELQRKILGDLFRTDDIGDSTRPCRLCGTMAHGTRSGLAYCFDCCVLAGHGLLRDNGTDGPWTDATIWALRRLAEIEFSGPPSKEQLSSIALVDPVLADEAMLCRFLIPRTHALTARPGRRQRTWTDWLMVAGLLADASRPARGILSVAADGHLCRSMFERHIDDFLHHQGIAHEVEPHYPRHHLLNTSGLRADWLLADGTYVEALGMLEQDGYAAKARRKMELARISGIRLVTIRPPDLNRLPEIFADWIPAARGRRPS